MYKQLLLLGSFLIASFATQAALIHHNGFERNSSSNIVKGGGLEWLKWDVTANRSINQALALYAPDGWRLASNTEMEGLYKSFSFEKSDWNNSEEPAQRSITPWTQTELSSHNQFVELFGATYSGPACNTSNIHHCYLSTDLFRYTQALFGSDGDKDALYKRAYIADDFTYSSRSNNLFVVAYGWNEAVIYEDSWNEFDVDQHTGVALVRSVNTPATLALLVIGLFLTGQWRRMQCKA